MCLVGYFRVIRVMQFCFTVQFISRKGMYETSQILTADERFKDTMTDYRSYVRNLGSGEN